MVKKEISINNLLSLHIINNMSQEEELRKMLYEMRTCIEKEDIKAGLPDDAGLTFDIETMILQWHKISDRVQSLKHHIQELDYDIAASVPWGDTVHNSEEGFTEGIPVTRYWTAPKECFEANKENWQYLYAARLVSEGDYLTYFTTYTGKHAQIMMEGASEAKVCPSPASTLIMLQTRAKDTLKFEMLKQNDFAVAHYREVESALGLKDTLKKTKRKKFIQKLRKIFRK